MSNFPHLPPAPEHRELAAIFAAHKGHVSDKWEQYLGIYEMALAPRVGMGRPLSLLEIGVQNGGSLQVWAKYLPVGSTVVGIDIDQKCAALDLGVGIEVYIGDASAPPELERLLGDSSFDIIVDDGSHRSPDIISTFKACFDRLRPGGIFIIEDLHASYIAEMGGGFLKATAAIEWLKFLADAVNIDYLSALEVAQLESLVGMDVRALGAQIARVSIYDSVLTVEKALDAKKAPYRRVLSGTAASVVPFERHLESLPLSHLRSMMLSPTAIEAFGTVVLNALATAKDQVSIESAKLHRLIAEHDTTRRQADDYRQRAHELTAELEAADARLRQQESELGELQRRVVRGEQSAADVAGLQEELDRVQQLLRQTRSELESEANRATQYSSELADVLNSTTWRATTRLRKMGSKLPAPMRRVVKRAGKAFWWTVSGQLPERLRRRREAFRPSPAPDTASLTGPEEALSLVINSNDRPEDLERAAVQASGLFDAAYYLEMNPDVAAGGIDPLGHYLSDGGKEGRDPSEAFSSSAYYARYPDVAAARLNPLAHYVMHGKSEGRPISGGKMLSPYVHQLFADRWPALRPLPVTQMPATGRRVTIVTDSINEGSLFGGVGTAIILGALLCNRMNATLRIATRTEPPDAGAVGGVLAANNVELNGVLEVAYAPTTGPHLLGISDDDLFLTTSWWTTRSTLGSVSPDRIIYLLQEDERMFYAHGDEKLLCSELLNDPTLQVVVNTELLHRHFCDGFAPLKDFAPRSVFFEPAFPSDRESPLPERTGRRKFFFYSRPHHARNLFWRGATVLSDAIEEGIFDPDQWEFYWVGRGTPALRLPRGVIPKRVEGLSWSEYQTLVSQMDAALVLMDTPHPSYPPLDLAAAGVAVLSNSHPGKPDLSKYSQNILVRSVAHEELLDGLTALARLATDDKLRQANRKSDGINRSWAHALDGVTERLAKAFEGR